MSDDELDKQVAGERLQFSYMCHLYAGDHLHFVIPVQTRRHAALVRELWGHGDGIHRCEVERRKERPYSQYKAWMTKLKLFDVEALRVLIYVEHYGIASFLAAKWGMRGRYLTPQRDLRYEIWEPRSEAIWSLLPSLRKVNLTDAALQSILWELRQAERLALVSGDTNRLYGSPEDDDVPF